MCDTDRFADGASTSRPVLCQPFSRLADPPLAQDLLHLAHAVVAAGRGGLLTARRGQRCLRVAAAVSAASAAPAVLLGLLAPAVPAEQRDAARDEEQHCRDADQDD